jgi:hypothetical protein
MMTGDTKPNPETAAGPGLGDVYTPVDPLPDMDSMTDDEMLDEDPALDQSGAEMPGNASAKPEQPALDGGDDQSSPGTGEHDADFEYDEEDVDQMNR